MRSYGLLILATAIISIVVYHLIVWKREYSQVFQPTTDYRVRRTLLPALGVCVFVSVVIVMLTASETGTSLLARLANNPGGWFALITGVISVVGVYVTLVSVLDIKSTIVSFADFVSRAERLIDETQDGDYTSLMLHTPAPGCLALPEVIWTKLADTMKTGHRLISLTCLNDKEMELWFKEYAIAIKDDKKKKDTMEVRIDIGLAQSKLIIDHVKNTAKHSSDITINIGVVEAEWGDLPLCYYVANSRRAIVVVPFSLPRPGASIYGDNAQPIQMIGFETTDSHIVDAVRQEVQGRRKWIDNKNKSLRKADEVETTEGAAAGAG